MKLFLVQHGDAVSKQVDPARPLSEKGRRDVERVTDFLSRAGVRVQKVLHSGKARSQQTAVRLAEVVMPDRPIEKIGGIEPNDDATAFALGLNRWDVDTFVIGHLPFVARLLSVLLVGDASHDVVNCEPGTVICLERQDEASWRLNWMIRPDLLANV